MDEIRNINPAGTLLEIVRKAKFVQAQGMNTSVSNWPVLFWAKVFDLPTPSNTLEPGGDVEVMSRLIQLRKLIHETENSLRSIEGINHDLFLRPFPRIRLVVNLMDLSSGYSTIVNITDGDIAVLEFCSDKLAERHSELIIDKEELSQILDEVNALFAEVHKSDLDRELRTFLLDRLEEIRRGIAEYQIRGIKRLQETLERSLGAVIVNISLLNQNSARPEVSMFSKIMSGLTGLLKFAQGATPLLEAVNKYLPPLLGP